MGARVSLPGGTDEALALGANARPDLLLVDYRLRDGDSGLATAAALRQLYPGLAAILISGDTAPDRLHKPVAIDVMKQALNDARYPSSAGRQRRSVRLPRPGRQQRRPVPLQRGGDVPRRRRLRARHDRAGRCTMDGCPGVRTRRLRRQQALRFSTGAGVSQLRPLVSGNSFRRFASYTAAVRLPTPSTLNAMAR